MDELEEFEARQREQHLEAVGPTFRRIAEQLDDMALEDLRTTFYCLGHKVRVGDRELVLEECVRILRVLRDERKKRGLS